MPQHNSGAMPKALALTSVILAAFVLVARLTQHNEPALPRANQTDGPQVSACPPYRQDQAPGPNAVPVYPNATKIRDESVDTATMQAAPFHVSGITLYNSGDDPAKITAFYVSALQKDGWWRDDYPQTATPQPNNSILFSWGLDTKPWTDPPCNATMVSGLGFQHVQLNLLKLDSGETQVTLIKGYTPGM